LKLREKTTATLLIAIFIMSTMVGVLPISLAASQEYTLPTTLTITQGYAQVLVDGSTVYQVVDLVTDCEWDPLEITMLVEGNNLVIDIVPPEGITGDPENFGLPFDVDCDGIMDWQIQYHTAPEDEDRDFNWAFSELVEVDGSVQGAQLVGGKYWKYAKDIKVDGKRQWSPLPDWITGTTSDQKTFTITIDLTMTGIELPIKFGLFMVESAPEGVDSRNNQILVVFPDPGFSWFDSTDLATLTIPTKGDYVPGNGKGLDKPLPNDNFAKGRRKE